MKRHFLFLFLVIAAVSLAEKPSKTVDHSKDSEEADKVSEPRPKQKATTLKTPEINLFSAMFRLPTGTVADVYGGKYPDTSVPTAVDAARAGDEGPLARILADLYGTLNRAQADAALVVVEKARTGELAKTPPDARALALLDRIFWAGKIIDGNPAEVEGSDKYNEAFEKAFKDRQDSSATIRENVNNALAGNEKAKEFLRQKLTRKMLMAFIDAQRKAGNSKLANDIVSAVAFGGANGAQKFLDLRVGKGETHRLNLGLTSASLEKALDLYSNARGGLHSTTLSAKVLSNPTRTFSVSNPKSFETPVAKRNQVTTPPTNTKIVGKKVSTTVARNEVNPNPTPPPSKPPGNTSQDKPKGTGGSLANFVATNCVGCHSGQDPVGTADGQIKKGNKVLSVADAVAAVKRVPGMRTDVPESVKKGLAAFLL